MTGTRLSSQSQPSLLNYLLMIYWPAWTLHSRCVEQTVKKVSEASKMVAGVEKRDGWIRAADASRRELPVMETKKDYMKLFN